MSSDFVIPSPAHALFGGVASEPAPAPITHVSIICSKGSLDMAYPGLILANAARMSGIEATLFFTFWGLDIVNRHKIENLHVSTVGNPAMPIPTMVGGLPGMESLATRMMKNEIRKLDLPTIPELIRDLKDAGARLYACRMAMDMFQLSSDDLVPEVDGVLSAMEFFEKSAGAQVIFI
jgi:peroxiredoxin family protein